MHKLYQHQREGIEFAIKNDGRCALFYSPGLGKTLTCLEIFAYFRIHNPGLRLFVVCPISLINAAWGEDIKKFTSFSYAAFKDLGATLPDIVIINYEAVISKKNLPVIKRMIALNDFMCVLDESSRLKNAQSLTTKTLLDLAVFFKHRIVASGTAMPNSEMELWGQMNFVQPGLLYTSFYAFRNTYFHLERDGDVKDMSGRRYVPRNEMRDLLRHGWKYTITPQSRALLMEEIRPFTHWVKKEDALDLPEKVDEIREVILSDKERNAYEEMKHHLVVEIEGEEVAAQVALTKLMKLRQATSGFFYGERRKITPIGKYSKLEALEELLEELGDQQAIIWIQFQHEVEIIYDFLSEKYGSTAAATLYSETLDKDVAIRRFQNRDARYLIAHPKSAAHGLTFVNCRTMIFFSLDYSYEAHTQARDRIHRIGQRDTCLYIYLIARDSIDEELLKVLNRKQGLQETVYALIRNNSQKQSHAVHSHPLPGRVDVQGGR